MEQQVIKLLTELRQKSLPMKEVAATINRKGFRKPHGGKFTDQDLFNHLWKEKQKAKLTQKAAKSPAPKPQSTQRTAQPPTQIKAQAPNQPPIDFIIRTLRSPDLTTEQKLKVVKDLL